MSDTHRGTVILIQRGDFEITGAIAEGMLEGKRRSFDFAQDDRVSGQRGAEQTRQLPKEQMEIVKAEIDRQHIQASLLRVAVGNTRTAEDYRHMLTKARGDYATRRRQITPARRVGGAILKAWALLCYGVALAYHSQERVLR